MKGIKRITVFIIFFTVLAIFTGAVAAADWNVTAGSNIQTAINNASENDTVIVNDNNGTAYTYIENVVINKKINLQAASDLVTIQSLNSSKPIITINSKGNGSTIQDFILTGSTTSSAIYLNYANNCLITGNDLTGNYYGIQLHKSTNNNITDNTISNNTNRGIYIYTNSTNNYLQNNNLTSNPYGIYILNSNNNQIIANTIENSTSYAIYINNANNTLINQNNLTNNNYGIYLYNAQGNALTANMVTNNTRIGIYVNTNSNNNNIQNNTLIGNQYGINTYNSQNNTIMGNSIFNSTYYGIYLSNSTQSTIKQNTINNSKIIGIYLNTNSSNNNIQSNNLTGNSYGIYTYKNLNNLLSGNIINNSTSYAIYLNNVNFTIITLNNITNNNYGLYLYNSQNNTINQNTLYNNTRIGIYVNTNSNNNNIQDNTLTGNQYGINTYNSQNNTISDNTVNNSTTGIYLNTNSNNNYILNNILTSNSFGIYIINCFNNTLSGNELKNSSSYAFYLNNVNNTAITQNNITNNNYGLYLYNSQNNTINQNTLYNNTRIGIYVNNNSNNNNIQDNTLTGNQYGINTYNSQNNTIIGNSISNTTYYGIYLSNSTQNTITENTINNSNSTGIFLNTNSTNNNIQNNTLTGNPYGIYLNYNLNNILSGNIINYSTSYAVYINNVNNTTIYQNNFNNNNYGIYLYNAQNNTLTENTVNNSTKIGMYINTNSNNNNIQNNTLNNNQYGINTYNSLNNITTGNIILNTTYYGIYLSNSTQNTITQNTINNSNSTGIFLNTNSNNNSIQNNTVSGNRYGVYLNSNSNDNYIQNNSLTLNQYGTYLYLTQNNIITSNTINNNTYDGIYLHNSSAFISFNSIAGNGRYGLYKVGNGTVNATNNWWSSNSPKVSSAIRSDIYMPGSMVNYDPWLVLNVTTTSDRVPHNGAVNITVDLTHDNNGNDTSPLGNIPNGIPIYFNTTLGTINTTVSTRNGKAITTLSCSSLPSTTNITISLDKQTVNKSLEMLGIYNERTHEGFSTIQSAINDNDTINGDIISIGEGTYIENVIVNKTLTLISSYGMATVKAANPSNSVFTINSGGSGSTIQGLNITGATGTHGINVNANNCSIIGNIISNNGGYGINIAGVNSTVVNNTVISNGNAGMVINSNYATVSNNTVVSNGNHGWNGWNQDGISVTGVNPIVFGNNVTSNHGTGISVNGNNAQILQNILFQNGGYGIGLTSVNATVTGNNATDNGNAGLVINSANVTISNNTVVSNGNRGWNGWNQDGLSVTGNNAIITPDNVIHDNHGTGLSVSGNNITLTDFNIYNNGGYGIGMTGLNLTVVNNTITNNGNAGIIINSNGITISGNTVTNNGNRGWGGWSWDGISITGNNVIVSGNNVTGNSRTGITVNGINAQILQNNILQNGGYGINIAGLNATIIGNNATNNGNAGIIVNSENSTISNNTAVSNGNRGFGSWSWDGINITGNNAIITPDNIIHDNSRVGLSIRGNNITLTGFNIYNNGGYGIDAAGLNLTITGNNITNNGNAGIVINSANATIIGNNATNNGNRGFGGWIWDGISITGTNIIVSGNNATGNGRAGITVNGDNAQILQNNILQNGGYGINAAGLNATIIGNNATNNGNAGIVVNGDCGTVSENNVAINGNHGFGGWSWDGLYVRGNNIQILQNSIIQNNGYGINAAGINLTISENNVTSNGKDGINVNGVNATIISNNVTSNSGAGVYVNGADAIVSDNTATNNQYGIYLYNSTGTAQSNNLTSNQYGIYLSNSSVNVNFNRIMGNSKYGLYNTGNGIIIATNNWWGSNNGPQVSSASPSDIYIPSGTVTYNPWLVLNIIAHPAGTTNSSTITADLTHNNAGNDTSPQSNVPDNIPITFITTLGNITSPAYTRNGKANAMFNRGIVSSGIANVTATLDNQTVQTNVVFGEVPLAIIVNPVGGMYNTTQNVTLITVDPDCDSTTYYTTDGSDPQANGIVYLNPIIINTTTTLRFIAGDPEGNWGPQYTQNYIIDTTPPTVIANIKGGVYNTTQTVNLTATDNADPNPVIYYTIDGTAPTTSSATYTDPITLQMNLTKRAIFDLKFMAVDQAGNFGSIQTETYILTLPVVDINNNNTYSTIPDAITDNSTLNGDIIQIYSGTYTETIILNKKLIVMPVSGNNVTIQAADPNGNVFTITNDGNGSTIRGLTINGNINLQANNCTIYLNNIIGNGTSGIITSNSFNNTLLYNTITCNGFNGIQSNSSSNIIYGNTISGCESGIYSENSNNNIISNNLLNNQYGIWTYNSTDTIQFNRITQNTYGLRNDIGIVNATNNWWGTNNPTSPNDIWIVSGNVTYNPWLILTVNPSSINSGGNTRVTVDLTHNNQGADTLSQGFIFDGIPINFNSSNGNIVNTAYTVKGQAVTFLNLNTTQPQNVTVSASLDNQSVSMTGLISTGVTVLNITSTAIDNSTAQSLNITYSIPLNESMTWLSVLWINTGMFSGELQIIVDGTVVQNKYFYNAAYTTWSTIYSPSVFSAILYTNQNLLFSSNPTAFWNNLQTTYNLTSEELTFVQNHRQDFIDNLTVNIDYPGVKGLNITVTDPQNNNVINLNFPGNIIHRTSQIIYQGSPYEGVKSFAIATKDVDNNVLQYWLDQSPNYPANSTINVAYNTFLTALMVEYLHDQMANNLTTQYNVTWSRTSPVIVSSCEDAYQTYLTLESDHSMGMTVVGKPENLMGFNYETSSAISLIEYAIMNAAYGSSTYQSYSPNGAFDSVKMNLYYASLYNNTETFMQNGFIIIKSIYSDNDFLVFDLETGILRDINTVNNFCGAFSGARTVISLTGRFYRHDNPVGEVVTFTRSFWWDGSHKVYIGNGDNRVSADDALSIWVHPDENLVHLLGIYPLSSGGTASGYYGNIDANPTPNFDITQFLNLGPNIIEVSVIDLYSSMIGSSPLSIIETNELLPPPPQESNKIQEIAEDAIGGGLITIGITALVAGGPVTWVALAVGAGCILCLDAAGVFKDPKNPQAWIKGGLSISTSAIPGFWEAKGITTISKIPWTLVKDDMFYSGGKWAANTGIRGLPAGIGTSVTWDFSLNNIMDYMGIPKHIY